MNPFNSKEKIPDEFIKFKEEESKRAEELKKYPHSPQERALIIQEYKLREGYLLMSFPAYAKTVEMYGVLHATESEILTAIRISGAKYDQMQKPLKEKRLVAFTEFIKFLKAVLDKISFIK